MYLRNLRKGPDVEVEESERRSEGLEESGGEAGIKVVMSGEKWKKKRGVAEKRIERSCENKCQAIATKTAGNKTNHERTIAARMNHNIDTLVHISMQCNSQRLVANSCRPRVLIRNSFPPSQCISDAPARETHARRRTTPKPTASQKYCTYTYTQSLNQPSCSC